MDLEETALVDSDSKQDMNASGFHVDNLNFFQRLSMST